MNSSSALGAFRPIRCEVVDLLWNYEYTRSGRKTDSVIDAKVKVKFSDITFCAFVPNHFWEKWGGVQKGSVVYLYLAALDLSFEKIVEKKKHFEQPTSPMHNAIISGKVTAVVSKRDGGPIDALIVDCGLPIIFFNKTGVGVGDFVSADIRLDCHLVSEEIKDDSDVLNALHIG